MPTYYFDRETEEGFARDGEGMDLENHRAAGLAAIAKLCLAGTDTLPKGDHERCTFAIHVRDEANQPVLKAVISYAFQWLSDPDGPQRREAMAPGEKTSIRS